MVDPRTMERFSPLCWIGEILMYTDPAQWQHVPTEQNLADLHGLQGSWSSRTCQVSFMVGWS